MEGDEEEEHMGRQRRPAQGTGATRPRGICTVLRGSAGAAPSLFPASREGWGRSRMQRVANQDESQFDDKQWQSIGINCKEVNLSLERKASCHRWLRHRRKRGHKKNQRKHF